MQIFFGICVICIIFLDKTWLFGIKMTLSTIYILSCDKALLRPAVLGKFGDTIDTLSPKGNFWKNRRYRENPGEDSV